MKYSQLLLLSILLIFASCNTGDENSDLSEADLTYYTETGAAIVEASFQTLSSNLKSAMLSGGVREAASYCNIAALPLTDSLSDKFGAKIKRTSLKLRNPLNAPDSMEAAVLEVFQKLDDLGMAIGPKVLLDDHNSIRYFAPIMINNPCLICHGEIGTSMLPENYALIQALYPEDLAIGYKENDLRGIWSISLQQK